MVTVTRYQLPALLLIVVGVGVMAQGFQIEPHPFQPEYGHTVEPIDAADVPSDAQVMELSQLSENARRAFHAARRSPDGHAVIYGQANKPPEFTYSDYSARYYVRYDGNRYELTTWDAGGLGILPELVLAGHVLVGIVSMAIGATGFRRGRTRLPATVLVGLVALWLTFRIGVYTISSNTQFAVLLGLILTAVPTIGTWIGLGRLWHGVE